MKKLSLFLVVVIAVIILPITQSCNNVKGPSGILLKFDPEKGKEYAYEFAWNMDQQVMGQDHKINITTDYSLKVIDDKNGIKTLRVTYNTFKMYMNIMGLEINVDTDKSPEPVNEAEMKANPLAMMDRVFAGIKGNEFVMTVGEDGKVLEVRGFDEIINTMIDSIAVGEDSKLQMKASLKDQFNEQAIKDQFAQVFSIFPGKEIKIGDNWEKNIQMGGRMPAQYKTTYTVKQIDGDHIMLTAQTAIGSGRKDMEIKGSQHGNLLVDSKTGLVVNAEFEQEIVSKTQGIEIVIKGKGKVKRR